MGKHTSRVIRLRARPPELSGDHFQHAAERFERHLLSKGYSADDAQNLRLQFSTFMAKELPEVSVLAAVQELRDLLSGDRSAEHVAPPFPTRTGTAALDYLNKHHGDEIRAGRLSPGQLAQLDAPLYHAVYKTVRRQEPPISMTDLFDSMQDDHKKGVRTERRSRACAAILGVSEDEAARFFGAASRTPRRGQGIR